MLSSQNQMLEFLHVKICSWTFNVITSPYLLGCSYFWRKHWSLLMRKHYIDPPLCYSSLTLLYMLIKDSDFSKFLKICCHLLFAGQ